MSVISLKNVCLDYVVQIPSRSLKKTLFSFIKKGTQSKFKIKPSPLFRSLDQLTLQFSDGDKVGLIGCNGAGKSTLLRVLAGIYKPSMGAIKTVGSVTPLFGVSFGLDADATGYENIVFLATLMGCSRKQILEKQQEIVEFSELGDFLFSPVRTYSSGMQLRLSFSILTSFETDILLIDEVIGVGDANFRRKTKKRINDLAFNTNIFVLATHYPQTIRELCNKVIYLEKGRVMFVGSVEEGLAMYDQREQAKQIAAPTRPSETGVLL